MGCHLPTTKQVVFHPQSERLASTSSGRCRDPDLIDGFQLRLDPGIDMIARITMKAARVAMSFVL